jgi:hypothetical protein
MGTGAKVRRSCSTVGSRCRMARRGSSARLGRPMTRPFAALERFLERLVERPAARLFRAPLQPVQLQRRLERMMDSGRVFSADRTYVPNRYRVMLNPADFVAFEAYQGTLEGELADAIHQRARARGYRLLARPEISLVGSDRVSAGDIHVTADLLDPSRVEEGEARRPVPAALHGDTPAMAGTLNLPVGAAASAVGIAGGGLMPVQHPAQLVLPSPGATPSAAPPDVFTPEIGVEPSSATALYPATREAAPLAILEIRTFAGPASQYTFGGGSVRVGRALDNEIVLTDDRVSRRHGQLTTRHGALVYTDLGSTNGSFVNGTRVSEIALGSGDVVRLGNSTLTIKPHH